LTFAEDEIHEAAVETILLVGDEAEIVDMAREALEGKGYRVLSAVTAEEAARIASGHDGPIHLLLTDAVMSGTSGQALTRQLGARRPEMKVLYMLAFTLIKGQQQFSDVVSGDDLGAPIILKPFTIERLTEKVLEVLAAKPRGPDDPPPDPWRHV
jgi:two-component system cell cycle sensor histidine kinase/response regulator CckA